ncbi:hypothetical protein Msi02_11380 [Microbispora siamensis]|uniref:Uncharacterized protein n=1 Tax=Microbispora siamensis TaxID=564413 RepID=A0ABQ4GFY0_9ACTN|nr:hypothetical protein Msi02_11380 [Microbispora siamensis]
MNGKARRAVRQETTKEITGDGAIKQLAAKAEPHSERKTAVYEGKGSFSRAGDRGSPMVIARA